MEYLKIWRFSLSVAFDEDFEAELSDNYDSKIEVSLLAKSPDSELTEVSYQRHHYYIYNLHDILIAYYLYLNWMNFGLNITLKFPC